MKIKWIGISICLMLMQTAHALTPIETAVREAVLKDQTAQIALLKKLVNMNSGTANLKGVYQVGNTLRPLFEKLGFKIKWVEEPRAMHKAGTLIATHAGKGKHLLLIAHLDTVFPANSPFQTMTVKKNLAWGPGTTDDKGGIVIILTALKALQAAHVLKDMAITVVLTGDEEESGKPTSISRRPLIDIAKKSDVALDFESAVSLDTATVARRGIAMWTLRAQGHEAHSGGIFGEKVGAGAAFELVRILHAMYQQLHQEVNLTFNPGLLVAGTKINDDSQTAQATVFGRENVIAKTAVAKGDVRFISEAQKQNFIQRTKIIVKEHLPGATAEITFQDGIPAMQVTKANLALLKAYSDVSVALGQGAITALPPGLRGAGDISHVAAFVPANLAGLGPYGEAGHSVDEVVRLNSLQIQAERAAILMYRLHVA